MTGKWRFPGFSAGCFRDGEHVSLVGSQMPSRLHALPANLPPRQIAREAAAAYVGISPTKFDELVKDGRMPKPRKIDTRRLWDVRLLDISVDQLPIDGESRNDNPWD